MKTAIKQTSILTLSNGFNRFLGMIFLVALTRLIDVSEYGQFRYLLNIASLFSLALTGTPISLAKFLGENPGDRDLRKSVLVNSLSIMSSIYLVIVVIFRILYKDYLLLDLLLLGLLIESLYIGFSRGLLNIVKLSVFRLVKNIIQLAAIGLVALLSLEIGVLEAVLFFLLSNLVSLTALEIYRREMEFSLSFSGAIIKKLINYTIPVTLGGVGWSVLVTVNPIIIERFRGTESVAYYTAGITLMQVFAFLPDAMATMILPKVAGIRDKRNIIKPFLSGVGGSLLINALILIPVYLFRERIIIIIFSSEYLNLAPIVLLLAVGQISLVSHQLFASFWQGLGRPAVPSITISVGCAINLVASIILTNIYGIRGAALSYALSTSCSLILIAGYFLLKRKAMVEV
ncbi:MAG: oligosaccharide flippase family protein [Candidatus Zixiibacteriota bacterium]|nr:MAG: oligosaccharide flippase family protein [candidate division Zixibacteria bacterium]